MSSSLSPVLALCDFNGTIVDTDMLRALAAFTDAAQSPFDRGTRADIEHYARQVSLNLAEAEERIEGSVQFDASFIPFERACTVAGVLLVVVTSGIRPLVEQYLRRRNIHLPVFANECEFGEDGWSMRFCDQSPSGIDKDAFVRAALREGRRVVVIGDDRSDFEAALAATTVFAKRGSALEGFLRERAHGFHAFSKFDEILDRWHPKTW